MARRPCRPPFAAVPARERVSDAACGLGPVPIRDLLPISTRGPASILPRDLSSVPTREKDPPVNLTPVRALTIIPAITLALTLLTGCTAAMDTGGGFTPEGCGLPGGASDSVEVAGEFGENLELTGRVPVSAAGFQLSRPVEGEGREIAEGLTAVGHLNIFIGSSGEVYAQEPTRMVMSAEGLAPWYYDTLRCAQAGDRVVSTVPAVEMLGEGVGESLGIAETDTMVVVVDLQAVLAAGDNRAVGAEQPLPEGFPEIALAENGAPSITIPGGFAGGSEVRSAARVVGSGPAVEASQTVLVHYRNVIARTGEVFDETWSGAAVSMPLDEAFPGFAEGLTGQPVGSQVVIVVPAGGGYLPEELESRGLLPDDVMVYVVDILDAG